MQTLRDSRGVDEVAMTDLAGDHLIETAQLTLALHWIVHLGHLDVVVKGDE